MAPSKETTYLEGGPLDYLGYTKQQKQAVYDYLLGKSPMPKSTPKFNDKTLGIISSNTRKVADLLTDAEKSTNNYRRRKLRELALMKAYKAMLDTGKTKEFTEAVEALYGVPDQLMFWGMLESSMYQARRLDRNPGLLDEVEKLINFKAQQQVPVPDTQVASNLFHEAQSSFQKLYSAELAHLQSKVKDKPPVHRYNDVELIELLEDLLKLNGLDKEGWVVLVDGSTDRLQVQYEKKQIRVAPGSFRLSRARAIGLALHEVAVHVIARKHIKQHYKLLGERRIVEEGLATFIEQMVLRRFRPVRVLRYLALGLSLGLDGKPRNAKEVYEIVWRLRLLCGGTRSTEIAKEYAAKEVARIFRGMPLGQKGVVITKDRAYVEGNYLIWSYIKVHGYEKVFENLLGKKI